MACTVSITDVKGIADIPNGPISQFRISGTSFECNRIKVTVNEGTPYEVTVTVDNANGLTLDGSW